MGANFGMFVTSSHMSTLQSADEVRKDDISTPSIDVLGIFAALAVPVLSGKRKDIYFYNHINVYQFMHKKSNKLKFS